MWYLFLPRDIVHTHHPAGAYSVVLFILDPTNPFAVLRVLHLYSLAKVVGVHPHIPKGCYTKYVTLHIIDHLVIVVDNNKTILYLPVTQQRFWRATFRELQKTLLFL